MNYRLAVNAMHLMNCALALALALCFGPGRPVAAQTKQPGGDKQQQPNGSDRTVLAQDEMKKGSGAFKDGKYAEAQGHFEKSLELDPTQKHVPFLIARAVHAQFRPGTETPENIAKAREAIAAYQKVLAAQPNNEEAYNAVTLIYGEIKDDHQQRAWILKRADQVTVPKEKRAEAYVVLAAKDWNCAHRITERPQPEETAADGAQAPARVKKPRDQKDFDLAKRCATSGLELVEKAVRLNPESEPAWNYKTKLLLEMVELAEMENRADQGAAYKKQAAVAQKRATELSEINRIKSEAVRSY